MLHSSYLAASACPLFRAGLLAAARSHHARAPRERHEGAATRIVARLSAIVAFLRAACDAAFLAVLYGMVAAHRGRHLAYATLPGRFLLAGVSPRHARFRAALRHSVNESVAAG